MINFKAGHKMQSKIQFKSGDVLICRDAQGYSLTAGKEYEIVEYVAADRDQHLANFVWPAYVALIDDFGKKCICHAHRFVKKGKSNWRLSLCGHFRALIIFQGSRK